MKICILLILTATTCLLGAEARKNWALLIAGSAGYKNYRHQADVCHAYQILHKAGIPDEQIVVMMYDDIANNEDNPYKGNIINKPGGPNVYPGVLKDYTGNEVTAKTFLAALQGDKEAVRKHLGRYGKVIDSGPDDYVFVYFADHGAPEILFLPSGPPLKASDLIGTLKKMHAEKKFAKLVFYVEACFSGSMFNKLLPNNTNIYVTTATNPFEYSYVYYYDEDRGTFLGDTYSVKWMEDSDVTDLHIETLEQQYRKVKQETTQSHVQQYGNLTIDALTLDKFFGGKRQISNILNKLKPSQAPISNAVPSEMVGIHSLKMRIEAAEINSAKRSQLEAKLASLQTTMKQTHKLIWDIARTVHSGLPEDSVYDLTLKDHNDIENRECYETAVDTLLAFCPGLDITTNDFAAGKFYVLVNLCNNNPINKVIQAVEAVSVVSALCYA